MTVDPSAGPDGRVPRHVWALLVVIVLILGFAVGGTVRAALRPSSLAKARPAVAAEAQAGPLTTIGSTPVAQLVASTLGATAAARPAPAAAPAVQLSAVRRGLALPGGSGTGRRIVYQQSSMHLWVIDADGTIIRDYPVTGRPGWPLVGTYHVFSKAVSTASPKYGVTFGWMVRFAHGRELSIGFHSIPRSMKTGLPIQSESSLGAPIGHGGCVRQRAVDAKWLYGWAAIGTTVVVLK